MQNPGSVVQVLSFREHVLMYGWFTGNHSEVIGKPQKEINLFKRLLLFSTHSFFIMCLIVYHKTVKYPNVIM